MIVERAPCDIAFEKEERSLRRVIENLRGAATTCVRQAAMDLARACGTLRDPAASILGAQLRENLRNNNYGGILDNAHAHVESNRHRVNFDDPTMPLDLIFVSAGSLESAVDHLLNGNLDDLTQVASLSVMSRSSSGDVLQINRHRA
jgi:hypothetical protein